MVARSAATSEIAAVVSRDAEKLQSRILRAMVREGPLRLRYPDVPDRPDQAYHFGRASYNSANPCLSFLAAVHRRPPGTYVELSVRQVFYCGRVPDIAILPG